MSMVGAIRPGAVKFDAEIMLEQALFKHKNMLQVLVAETAIWANPAIHHRLASTGNAAWYPNTRRARSGKGEVRGKIIDGIRFDDNTYANYAIKRAIGVLHTAIRGYAVCHIWNESCYDERHHTVIANLVLLPRPLAGLTDHHTPVKKMLQYRAYEIYGWYPSEQAMPMKPDNYVSCWREPEPDILHRPKLEQNVQINSSGLPAKKPLEARLAKWAQSPKTKVHKIISLVLSNEGIIRDKLLQILFAQGISRNPSGAIASLMTDAGNSYGPLLLLDQNHLFIRPEVKRVLVKLNWMPAKEFMI